MKYILSRYEHDISWVKDYTDDVVMYDRSKEPVEGSIIVPNIGSDIYDKLGYIIDNYDNLPEVAVYAKANLFKYISEEEFNKVKNNTIFTPLLTQNHRVYEPVCYYENGMYHEINDNWYVPVFEHRYFNTYNDYAREMGLSTPMYLCFAPGSNYIIPKANVLKHSKEFYVKIRSYLGYTVYPAEAQMVERSLYEIFN